MRRFTPALPDADGEIRDTALGSRLQSLEGQVADLTDTVGQLLEEIREERRLAAILIDRITDPTHLTIEELARYWDVSEVQIRRKINAGQLTLEVIPGTRRSGIPVREVRGRWIPIQKARRAAALEREARD